MTFHTSICIDKIEMSKKFSSYSATFLGRKTSNPSPPVDKYVGLGGGSTLPAINGCGGPRPCKAAQNLPHIPQMHCPSHQDCFQYFRLFFILCFLCVSSPIFLSLVTALPCFRQICLFGIGHKAIFPTVPFFWINLTIEEQDQ